MRKPWKAWESLISFYPSAYGKFRTWPQEDWFQRQVSSSVVFKDHAELFANKNSRNKHTKWENAASRKRKRWNWNPKEPTRRPPGATKGPNSAPEAPKGCQEGANGGQNGAKRRQKGAKRRPKFIQKSAWAPGERKHVKSIKKWRPTR